MNNLFKTLIAGYGAKKLGGGCFSTILIFIVIYWAWVRVTEMHNQYPAVLKLIPTPFRLFRLPKRNNYQGTLQT